MLTEDRVRRLLDAAAATIDVAPAHIEAPPAHHRRWLVPAVVAAAVVLVAAGVTAGRSHHNATPVVTQPTENLYPGDPRYHLGPDQVPSLAGLDDAQAKALLERDGYRVEVKQHRGCPEADTYLNPSPTTGTVLDAGSTITLYETVSSPSAPCPSGNLPAPEVRRFLAWARGFGPSPRFAATVQVQVGSRTTTLRGADTHDRAAWPGLDTLSDVLSGTAPARGRQLPLMVSALSWTCAPAPGGSCPMYPGAQIRTDQLATNERADLAALFDVSLGLDRAGRIRAVYLTDRRPPVTSRTPDVVGDSQAYATARLQAFGYTVDTEDVDGCGQQGLVVGVRTSGTKATLELSNAEAACAD